MKIKARNQTIEVGLLISVIAIFLIVLIINAKDEELDFQSFEPVLSPSPLFDYSSVTNKSIERPHSYFDLSGNRSNFTWKTLSYHGFHIEYSDDYRGPMIVTYHLPLGLLDETARSGSRPGKFKVERRTEAMVKHADYTNTGYDRGHMAPNMAISDCYGRLGQIDTFFMSNVWPQKPAMNRGPWKRLERQVINWAMFLEEIWVITGPIFDEFDETLPSGVHIPDAFFKVIIDETNGIPRALAFIVDRDADKRSLLSEWVVSVDDIESAIGVDLMSKVPEKTQARIESVVERIWGNGKE